MAKTQIRRRKNRRIFQFMAIALRPDGDELAVKLERHNPVKQYVRIGRMKRMVREGLKVILKAIEQENLGTAKDASDECLLMAETESR